MFYRLCDKMSCLLNESLVVMLYDIEKEAHLYINETLGRMVAKDGKVS